MLEVITPAFIMTFQDGGRKGYQRYGVPTSGPMDWLAHHTANLLVANAPDATCLELGISSARLQMNADALIAVTGGGYKILLDGEAVMPLWTAIWVHRGVTIDLVKVPGGNWAYLAVAGAFKVDTHMGSQSTYARAGLGQKIKPGDHIDLQLASNAYRLAGKNLTSGLRPKYHTQIHMRAMVGPHIDRFTQAGLDAFWQSAYKITSSSDRMGLRLQGEPIQHQNTADIISQGMVLGAVQVPADGQPIIMMPDHPTSGGYAQIAVVARVDLPFLAQCEPGLGLVRFSKISIVEAQRDYRQFVASLEPGLRDIEEDWMLL